MENQPLCDLAYNNYYVKAESVNQAQSTSVSYQCFH